MLGAALLAATMAARFDPPKLYGDWYAGCDNVGACAAIALLPENEVTKGAPAWTLSIWIDGGSKAARMFLQKGYDPSRSTSLRIDGKSANVRFSRAGAVVSGDVAAVLPLLASAHSLELVDPSGKVVGRVSADGAAAALRWIADQQRRSAGEARLPSIAVSARSAAAPVKLPRTRLAAIRKAHDCDQVPPSWTPEFHRLDASSTVGIIPCSLAAYQGDGLVVIVDNEGKDRPALIEADWRRDPEERMDPPNDLVDPEWDGRRTLLRTSWKDSGAGGCGGSEAYVWDGRQFRLAYQAVMDECRGSFELVPIWRTSNVSSLDSD